ncbi:MAG: chemotaxis-specific protein-glutamate methyltransferase CheB [Planctomycetota bacterium]
MIRLLIVDDSSFIRRQLARMVQSERDITVVGHGANGDEALKLIDSMKPDVVTLDVEMPGTDGMTALKQLRRRPTKPAILMCSTLTVSGSRTAVEALSLGAADVIAKDTAGDSTGAFKADLLAKIRALGTKRTPAGRSTTRMPPSRLPQPPRNLKLIAIGSSTGGPPVLEQIIRSLPERPGVAVAIAQHMPAMFTKSLAERLNEQCRVSVKMAVHGEAVTPGHVYICEGGTNTRIDGRANSARFAPGRPSDAGTYFPSVDALLRSSAESMGTSVLGIVLTGMGEDGKLGAQALQGAGAKVVAQDARSCVVYGMPRAVVEAGFADAVMDPNSVTQLVSSLAAAGSGGVPVRRSA